MGTFSACGNNCSIACSQEDSEVTFQHLWKQKPFFHKERTEVAD